MRIGFSLRCLLTVLHAICPWSDCQCGRRCRQPEWFHRIHDSIECECERAWSVMPSTYPSSRISAAIETSRRLSRLVRPPAIAACQLLFLSGLPSCRWQAASGDSIPVKCDQFVPEQLVSCSPQPSALSTPTGVSHFPCWRSKGEGNNIFELASSRSS